MEEEQGSGALTRREDPRSVIRHPLTGQCNAATCLQCPPLVLRDQGSRCLLSSSVGSPAHRWVHRARLARLASSFLAHRDLLALQPRSIRSCISSKGPTKHAGDRRQCRAQLRSDHRTWVQRQRQCHQGLRHEALSTSHCPRRSCRLPRADQGAGRHRRALRLTDPRRTGRASGKGLGVGNCERTPATPSLVPTVACLPSLVSLLVLRVAGAGRRLRRGVRAPSLHRHPCLRKCPCQVLAAHRCFRPPRLDWPLTLSRYRARLCQTTERP